MTSKLQELLSKKEELAQRKDLSSDERERALRRIRKEIRQLCKAEGIERPTRGSHSSRPREKKLRIVSSPPVLPEETLVVFKNGIREELLQMGLSEGHGSGVPYAFSLSIGMEAGATTETFVKKFRARWPEIEPTWFDFSKQGKDILLLLGEVISGLSKRN